MRTRSISLLIALIVLSTIIFSPSAQAQTRPTAGQVNSTANLRGGPGTTFPVVGSLAAGADVQIAACNDDCTWYQLSTGEWIAAFLVDATAGLPTPTVAVTAQSGDPITIVSWNVESGGALQNVVADRMAALQDVDIWGMSEVNAIDAEAYEFGAEEGEGANFDSYLGTTGRADRLLLIWDAERFGLIASGEMLTIGETGRAPLWAQLREQATGLEFIVMVNHLHRSNDGIRHRQATALNAWAATQTLPVVAMGDWNFDWNLPNGESDHDLGYDNLTANGVWQWVRPAELVTTQCSGWPCSYNSVLDFFFVAGPAQDWNIASEIIVAENDFPDDVTTPDHRPVMAVIMPDGTTSVPILVPTATPVDTAPVLLPTATAIPPVASTVAPTCPQANTNGNLRSGPGTGYGVVGSVQQGECIIITGRTEASDWLQLSNGNWIAAFLVANAGPMESIPVVVVAGPTPVPAAPTAVPAAPTSAPQPAQPTPVPPTAVPQPVAPSCDPNYAGACIPIVGHDLNCPDVGVKRFQSIGSDPHGFDRDNDGIACEN